MSSYIKFMFKYLFEPESLSAELLDGGGNSSGLFILSPGQQQQQQQPANNSASLLTGTSSPPANALGDNLVTSSDSSSSGLVSLTIINKSPSMGDQLGRAHQQQLANGVNSAEWLWLQQQSADGAASSKLWPSKCLGFVRLFAMAQNNNNNNINSSPNGTTSTTVATNGTGGQLAWQLSSPTATLASGSSSSSSSWPENSLLVRLGSFAEFEHLIRQQLAGLFNGNSTNSTTDNSNNNNNYNNTNYNISSNNNNNSHWHRGIRSAHSEPTGASLAAPDSSPLFQATSLTRPNATDDQHHYRGPLTGADQAASSSSASLSGGNLLRLLIRSIGANQEHDDDDDDDDDNNEPPPATLSAGLNPAASLRQIRHVQTMISAGQQPSGSSTFPSLWPNQQDATATIAATSETILGQHQQRAALVGSPTMVNSADLLECYKDLQLGEYYQGYDIFVGLRIASTLTILFVVFILFVIYKTGCRDSDRVSRSQLRLTSAVEKVARGAPPPPLVGASVLDSRRRLGVAKNRSQQARNDCAKPKFASSNSNNSSSCQARLSSAGERTSKTMRQNLNKSTRPMETGRGEAASFVGRNQDADQNGNCPIKPAGEIQCSTTTSVLSQQDGCLSRVSAATEQPAATN